MVKKENTKEFEDVIHYMSDVLIKEFPNTAITTDYLVSSFLYNRKSNAHIILDTFLRTQNMNDLRNIFTEHLREKSNANTCLNPYNSVQCDQEVENIFEEAKKESELFDSPKIGTEHVLLAILNPSNEHKKMREIFLSIGIDYNFIVSRCKDSNKRNKNQAKNIKYVENPMLMNRIPLQSEINQKMMMDKNKFIDNFTIDITKMATQGKLEELVGRENETNQIIHTLARRKKNNVVIVGNGGVGKTAMVYGLANKIVKNEVPSVLSGKKIVQLNISALISGTFLRGSFEERVKGLFDEMSASDKYILFIDDIHTCLKSTSKERDTDITPMITSILSDGDIKVIATTTYKDYRNSIESNSMIARRFQKIVLEPTTKDETFEILQNNKHYYEDYHNVRYTDEALKKCVELADRYITDRSLPDSAIDVLDFSGAQICLRRKKPSDVSNAETELVKMEEDKTQMVEVGNFEAIESMENIERQLKKIISEYERDVSNHPDKYTIQIEADDVCQSVAELTNIPISKIGFDEKKKLATVDQTLKSCVIGQDEAIDKICKVIKRNKIGLGNRNKPIATMLLVGRSGIGKTLIAKKLAEEIFGDSNYLVRIDMSEYSEKNSVSKLTGAAPGYIGYDNGGQLTEAVKNKQYCVLLLDEIEKADQEVYNVFLQLFDEGRLTDNSGQIVNFKNTIILMTSNVGTKKAQEFGHSIGFDTSETTTSKSIIEKEIKNKFAPEFINRLDQIVYFNDLTDENIHDIAILEIEKLIKRVNGINYNVTYDDSLIDLIANECKKRLPYSMLEVIDRFDAMRNV